MVPRRRCRAHDGYVEASTSRAYLQSRLTVLYKLMFWAFSALMAFLWVAYRLYPAIEPRRARDHGRAVARRADRGGGHVASPQSAIITQKVVVDLSRRR